MKNKRLPAQNEINNCEEVDDNIFELETPELEDAEEWGDNDDSGWEDEVDLMCNLKWNANSEFEKTKRGPYKTSKIPRSMYYDKWGPSGSFTKSAIGTSKITSFFPAQFSADDAIKNLNDQKSLKKELESQHNKMKVTEYNKKRAIFEYLNLLNKNGGEKMKASLNIAQMVFVDGKHKKTIRLIDDEDVAEKCHSWILRWLHILRYTKQRQKQGIYYDGHERADVIQYRNTFLKQIFEYEKLMSHYEGENMDRILPDLAEDEKEYILVTHDECNGKSVMVSEFLTEVDRRLKLKPEEIEQHPTVPVEAREYLEPGKDREGYWTAENVLNQIKTKAIPIFEALYPNCIGIFAFDNSSNHAIFAKNALVSKKMNLNPGGV
ncbi:hypothetical protein C1645_825920 [Glomus cerebriforme]|uniref:Uncharacterized protein n=1 Tax=Glomus cerebriforme TaxID=658196 RepID=A0A397SY34_9GLOM|nr:hypothetical protein C1645_825920 [Glomus cerebriforme]